MSLILSDRDQSRVAAALEVLVSPLDFDDAEVWQRAALGRVDALLGTDRSLFSLPTSNGLAFVSENVPPETFAAIQGIAYELDAGQVRFPEEKVDRAVKSRHAAGMDVWSHAGMERVSGIAVEEMRFYHEVARPGGLVYGFGMRVPLQRGEAQVFASHANPSRDRWGEDASLALLRLLLPAFQAGVYALRSFGKRRAGLAVTLDRLGLALLVVDADGRELHRTPELGALLEKEPERERLLGEARALARRTILSRGWTHGSGSAGSLSGTRAVRTSNDRYSLRAVRAPRGQFSARGVVVCALERRSPALPSEEALRDRYQLTPRQAEVTMLLARGLSDREIAEQLGVSEATVGNHNTVIFGKLGVRSRKALGLRLLRDV